MFVEAEEACHGGGGGGGNGIGEDQDEGATFPIAWIDKKCLPSKVAAVGTAVVHPEGCVLTRRD